MLQRVEAYPHRVSSEKTEVGIMENMHPKSKKELLEIIIETKDQTGNK